MSTDLKRPTVIDNETNRHFLLNMTIFFNEIFDFSSR